MFTTHHHNHRSVLLLHHHELILPLPRHLQHGPGSVQLPLLLGRVLVHRPHQLADHLRLGTGPSHHLHDGPHVPGDADHRHLEARGPAGGGGGGGEADPEAGAGGVEEAGAGEGEAGGEDLLASCPGREGVTTVGREGEGGEDHQEPGTVRPPGEGPGAGREEGEGAGVVGGGEDGDGVGGVAATGGELALGDRGGPRPVGGGVGRTGPARPAPL